METADGTQRWQDGRMGPLVLAGGSVSGYVSENHFVSMPSEPRRFSYPFTQ